MTTPMKSTSLRDLVADGVHANWADFTAQHPHLAAAIDRTVLIDSTVARLRDDPEYQLAMRQAAVDEATLATTQRLRDFVQRWVVLALGI